VKPNDLVARQITIDGELGAQNALSARRALLPPPRAIPGDVAIDARESAAHDVFPNA
jgi:hypothetical protein